MNKISVTTYNSGIGELIIGEFNNSLCLCDWNYRKQRSLIDQRLQKGLNAQYISEHTSFHDDVIQQLDEYLETERQDFQIPLTLIRYGIPENSVE